ncbi:hypothetical protein BO85DRAFT_247153 [Aspergillus piperis CBS 112811]|uniref:Uncharacterized protein n=1 Tax=Aspergillus piperis CBS 112811 TaxID=1448313 RepID=A0A8G1R7F1_9EURO|nr:hypothetical protein BO85DRAFT_247153 [Aspergillus piperis CBS 112811]RAH59639.1 hypothetical protein BO85DRAFT_247153 [Aspergillus piperis CBS 112811]
MVERDKPKAGLGSGEDPTYYLVWRVPLGLRSRGCRVSGEWQATLPHFAQNNLLVQGQATLEAGETSHEPRKHNFIFAFFFSYYSVCAGVLFILTTAQHNSTLGGW